MSFKEYFFKKMIPNYFMIVTLITIGMAVTGILFYGNRKIDMVTLFVPSVFGALGCLPLLDFFFMKIRGLRYFLYNLAELIILELCLLTAGYFVGMVNSVMTFTIMALMIFAIFAVVGAIMYLQDRKFCDSLNDALAEYARKSGD